MKQLNRRNWLRLAGLAGSATLVTPPSISDWKTAKSTTVPGQDVIARLSSNENPFGPSEKVRQAMIDGFEEACRYPYGKQRELSKLLAEKEGVQPEEIVITGGSTEGLKATGLTFGLGGGEIISADPTYLSLLSYASQFGAFINKVPLNDKLEHDLDEMAKRVSNDTKLVFVCNPNNPSGTIIPKDKLTDFCESVSRQAIVFSDEAYGDYITEPDYPSMVSLVKKGANVVVSRTFSKVYGLAGVRIGYLIARADLAQRISENVMARTNMLALFAAEAALKDDAFYQMSLKKNTEAKEHIYGVLDQAGLKYVPSHTNFVFFHTGRPIGDVISAMSEKGVRIGRPFPPLTDWCRISTGSMDDVEKFGEALIDLFA